MLKDQGIAAAIAVGTAARGAVPYTASVAALQRYHVIVPVDGMSGNGKVKDDEQAVAYLLATVPIVSGKVTLTSTEMIKFQ